MKHPIGIVLYPASVHAWALDLPGCIAGAPTTADLDEPLRLALADHIAWLAKHGEALDESTGWEAVETVDRRGLTDDVLFRAEQRPVIAAEFESFVLRLRAARDDFISATSGMPTEVLDWIPPASAFGSFDVWAPEVRTIRDVSYHVLQFERYYRGGLQDGPACGISEAPEEPWVEHRLTVEALRSSSSDSSRLFKPLRPGATAAEEWTLRKVVRRMLSHQRVHTAEILQRSTWVLLGVPTRAAR